MQTSISTRTGPNRVLGRPSRALVVRPVAALNVEQLKAAKQELSTYINSKNCNPIV